MKLFAIATLIAVSAAARLEHLENAYLPPDQAGQGSNSIGSSVFGSKGPGAINGAGLQLAAGLKGEAQESLDQSGDQEPLAFGQNGAPKPFGQNGAPKPFGQNGALKPFGQNGAQKPFGQNGAQKPFGQNGFGSSAQNGNGFGTGADAFGAATSNQYLPPDNKPSGANGLGGPKQGGCCGPNSGPRNQFGASPNGQAPNSFSNRFGQPSQQYQSQFAAANRQYLTPKETSNPFENIPQQSFDEETGYHY